MTARQALAFIRKHGIVLEAARGPVPSLAEAIAGGRFQGSWWSHPRSDEIFAVTRAVRDSDDVLVCRLVKGKVTFVHRRLWPALVRAARREKPFREVGACRARRLDRMVLSADDFRRIALGVESAIESAHPGLHPGDNQ